jgi:hypothetical protein
MDAGAPFFGLDGTTGGYLLAAQPEELAKLALSEQLGEAHVRDIRARLADKRPSLGVADTVHDVADLAQTGWGVIFPEQYDPEIKRRLGQLLEHRRAQAGRLFCEYTYRRGETKQTFLRRNGVSPSGTADPEQMPYYLLLVGGPEDIPFSFQYQLDVQYAVGRLHFTAPEQYASYAQSVVAAENGEPRARTAALFGPSNRGDLATQLSATRLVAPLAEHLINAQKMQSQESRWSIETYLGDGANKSQLRALLGGAATPSLLFTASHGVGFPAADARQRKHQGALVCQDWPGPGRSASELAPEVYMAADDILDDAALNGLIAIHFACFGAGTPRLDDYPQFAPGSAGPLGLRMARPIAPEAFVASLPARLLSHRGGAALAVIGHVERALGSSFLGDSTKRMGVFGDLMGRLMRGVPVGNALEPFNERYAEVCADLTSEVREVEQNGKIPEVDELAALWTGSADARGYVILGDPAVRLAPRPAPLLKPEESQIVLDSTDSPPIAHASANGAPTDHAPLSVASASGNARVEVDPATGRIIITTPWANAAGSVPDVSYGLFGGQNGGSLAEARSALADGLQRVGSQVAGLLSELAKELATLEVETCTSDDLDGVDYDADQQRYVGAVRRRALTRMRLDGKTTAIVPSTDGALDEPLWTIHCQLVERAQAQRAELLKALTGASSSIMGVVKPF